MLMLILLMHMLMIFLVKTVTTPFDCMISIWMHAHKIVTGVQYNSEHAHDLYLNACSSSTRNLHLEWDLLSCWNHNFGHHDFLQECRISCCCLLQDLVINLRCHCSSHGDDRGCSWSNLGWCWWSAAQQGHAASFSLYENLQEL